ncbi:hypothetical protein [Geosporobacter ferrireducens]|uniref:hypothetical protein n=1 Tax=Geosporobacter ferrireducens TaxID=1424294 RepID=UPI0012EAA503|nr:hypothetical protein [Geosporobacter ferrireducens]
MDIRNKNNTDVNGYLSELIRSDKKNPTTKNPKLDNVRARFCSDCVNDAIGKLDITV